MRCPGMPPRDSLVVGCQIAESAPEPPQDSRTRHSQRQAEQVVKDVRALTTTSKDRHKELDYLDQERSRYNGHHHGLLRVSRH